MTGAQLVANHFLHGIESRKGNVFTDGTTAYSYRHSYPIARRIDAQTVIVNAESYSKTTSTHRNAIINQLRMAGYRDIGEDGCKLDAFDARVFSRA